MSEESGTKCDLCGSPLPPTLSEEEFAEKIIDDPDFKFPWIMIGNEKGNEKFLCKKCVRDVLKEVDALELIDWFLQETEDE